jgi:hypothetical protein
MLTLGRRIAEAAIAARTTRDAGAVQEMIADAVGGRHERPLADRWNNLGMLTGSGASYDYKVLELVTNMQDAVIELEATLRHGGRDRVPYQSPHSAVEDLFHGADSRDLAKLTQVKLYPASSERSRKQATIVFRDKGCGMTPNDVPSTIFHVGSSHKDGVDWLQGKFGLGGATTYRNARAVVLVTRRHPSLLSNGVEDRITVAVVQWQRHKTTLNAYYLVAAAQQRDGVFAEPYSFLSADFPEFEPGTYLALIAYDGTSTLTRKSGDDRSFDTIFNTRLFQTALPLSYQNLFARDRDETLRGLRRRLDDNIDSVQLHGSDEFPFHHHGRTYDLPVNFWMFARPNERGERRNFVAHNHALAITSNGQVHAHWTPGDFKRNTRLKKLYDRIFITVESDRLPIEMRTELFTADRAEMVKSPAAATFVEQLAEYLDQWHELDEVNSRLIREAVTGGSEHTSTLGVAKRIARALSLKGFSLSSEGSTSGGPRPPAPSSKEDLYEDPTHFEGPEETRAFYGKANSVYFRLNAVDDFIPDRTGMSVVCGHPDIGDDEITVGRIRGGRIRVSIAVPDGADLGSFQLHVEIGDWIKTSGGMGPRFTWTTKLEVLEERTASSPPTPGAGKRKGGSGAGPGGFPAVVWKTPDERDEWTKMDVGDITMVRGRDLAESNEEYAELANVNQEVPTITLNRVYPKLKDYIRRRSSSATQRTIDDAYDRYAIGVGVGLLLLEDRRKKLDAAGMEFGEELLGAAASAVAGSVLSVMPDYDKLAKEVGLDED